MTSTTPPKLPSTFDGAIDLNGYNLGSIDPKTHRYNSFFIAKQLFVPGYVDDYYFKITTPSDGGAIVALANEYPAYTSYLVEYDKSHNRLADTFGNPGSYGVFDAEPSTYYYVDSTHAGSQFNVSYDAGFYVLPQNPDTYVDADHDDPSQAVDLGVLSGVNSTVNCNGSLFVVYDRAIPTTTSATAGSLTVLSTKLVNDQVDFYKFTLPTSGKLTISASGAFGGVILDEPPQGNVDLASSQLITGTKTLNLVAGTYAIEVYDTATQITQGANRVGFTFDWELYNNYSLNLSFAGSPIDLSASVSNLKLGGGLNTNYPNIQAGGRGTLDITLHNSGGTSAGTDVGITSRPIQRSRRPTGRSCGAVC